MTYNSLDLFNYIKEGKTVLLDSDIGWAVVCLYDQIEAIQTIRKTLPKHFESFLVADDAMLQTYVPEIPEQAWDLLDLNENPLFLILEGIRNIDEALLDENKCSSFRSIQDYSPLYNLVKRLRKPLWSAHLIAKNGKIISSKDQLPNELLDNCDYVLHLQTQKNQSRSYSVIKIRLNGEIRIVKK